MAEDLIQDVRKSLRSSDAELRESAFSVLQRLAALVNAGDAAQDADVQELVLRTLERRQEFGALGRIVDDLARVRGLYPYLSRESMGLTDAIQYEFHRPAGLDNIVFHQVQWTAYMRLQAGRNLVLSAPTSFGKSLIIDAMLATGEKANVVIVVPTIALIDETRRRIMAHFRDRYKVITHIGQEFAERNVLVLTQERVVDMPELPDVDFFVIDEFYKLDPSMDAERSTLLNEALYRLHQSNAQFFLLGPNIESIPQEFYERYKCDFIKTDYRTVDVPPFSLTRF